MLWLQPLGTWGERLPVKAANAVHRHFICERSCGLAKQQRQPQIKEVCMLFNVKEMRTIWANNLFLLQTFHGTTFCD